ncbi:alpha/beta fold hydrolase [Pacificimonas sp. ICDLI1SI03]
MKATGSADLVVSEGEHGWFADALAAPFEALETDVHGARIEVRAWGRRGAPGLVFVHGNGAHLGWWSHLAPFFAQDYRVVAFSLGGMGQSQWRSAYSIATFADELWAAVDVAGAADCGPPVVIAHSLGGAAAIHASAWIDRAIRAVILVDVALPFGGLKVPERNSHKIYDTRDDALSRFRLSPAQPEVRNLGILGHLAQMAIRPASPGELARVERDVGWTWRFDPTMFGRIELGDLWSALANMRCQAALVRGELSFLTQGKEQERMVAVLPDDTPDVIIPRSYHHIMVDQPIALVAALRSLLSGWAEPKAKESS